MLDQRDWHSSIVIKLLVFIEFQCLHCNVLLGEKVLQSSYIIYLSVFSLYLSIVLILTWILYMEWNIALWNHGQVSAQYVCPQPGSLATVIGWGRLGVREGAPHSATLQVTNITCVVTTSQQLKDKGDLQSLWSSVTLRTSVAPWDYSDFLSPHSGLDFRVFRTRESTRTFDSSFIVDDIYSWMVNIPWIGHSRLFLFASAGISLTIFLLQAVTLPVLTSEDYSAQPGATPPSTDQVSRNKENTRIPHLPWCKIKS